MSVSAKKYPTWTTYPVCDFLEVSDASDQARAMVPSSHINTNSKASRVYDLLGQGDLLEVWKTGGQAFVVVPELDVSISQKICNINNVPHRGYLLEVSRTNNQVAAAVLSMLDVREYNGISDAPHQHRLEVPKTNNEASKHSYVGRQYS